MWRSRLLFHWKEDLNLVFDKRNTDNIYFIFYFIYLLFKNMSINELFFYRNGCLLTI